MSQSNTSSIPLWVPSTYYDWQWPEPTQEQWDSWTACKQQAVETLGTELFFNWCNLHREDEPFRGPRFRLLLDLYLQALAS